MKNREARRNAAAAGAAPAAASAIPPAPKQHLAPTGHRLLRKGDVDLGLAGPGDAVEKIGAEVVEDPVTRPPPHAGGRQCRTRSCRAQVDAGATGGEQASTRPLARRRRKAPRKSPGASSSPKRRLANNSPRRPASNRGWHADERRSPALLDPRPTARPAAHRQAALSTAPQHQRQGRGYDLAKRILVVAGRPLEEARSDVASRGPHPAWSRCA